MGVDKLRLGVPKGSLEKATLELFRRSGWHIQVNGRSYFPDIDDPEITCSMCRAQEMSRYVENGTLDCGITGQDWTMENDSQVTVVADLMYSKASLNPVRWVVAVPADSEIRSLRDLAGKKIATELVNYTRRYFKERQIPVTVEFSWGATEAKVAAGLADAIVEVTETGSTIKAHGLKIIHELFQSNTQFIANNQVWESRRRQAGEDGESQPAALGGAPGRTHGGPQDEHPGEAVEGHHRPAAQPAGPHHRQPLRDRLVLGGGGGEPGGGADPHPAPHPGRGPGHRGVPFA